MIGGKWDMCFSGDGGFYIGNKLGKGGGEMYVLNGGFDDCKMMMVEEGLCRVGSRKVKRGSVDYDYEMNGFIVDLGSSGELGEVFEKDKVNSRIMRGEEYKKGSVWGGFVGWFGDLFRGVI